MPELRLIARRRHCDAVVWELSTASKVDIRISPRYRIQGSVKSVLLKLPCRVYIHKAKVIKVRNSQPNHPVALAKPLSMAIAVSSWQAFKYSGTCSLVARRRANSSQTGGHSEPGEQKTPSTPLPLRMSTSTAAPLMNRTYGLS